ncbi:hypothetical protein ACHAXS_013189 [Conticribra weissflogii]
MAASPFGSSKPVRLPTVSFSLAAIVRVHHRQSSDKNEVDPLDFRQQYVLVHERPPRGWWLPGGGIEHEDETPVHAAIRETLEEAADPLLMERGDEYLPRMTHLISLEQTSGRIRFIFRGEWLDDDSVDHHNGHGGVLKRPPGDDDSIEAKWIEWEDIQHIPQNRIEKITGIGSQCLRNMHDPWLRGHEPHTFYESLEKSSKSGEMIRGLPIKQTSSVDRLTQQCKNEEKEPIGAFFLRMKGETPLLKNTLLKGRGRAELLVNLHCRLLLHDKSRNLFAVEKSSGRIPFSSVTNQFDTTLKRMVDKMIKRFQPPRLKQEDAFNPTGLLRVEHIIHENGREATLTVFPGLQLCSLTAKNDTNYDWLPADELRDDLERRLAMSSVNLDGKFPCTLDIIRDKEGPIIR